MNFVHLRNRDSLGQPLHNGGMTIAFELVNPHLVLVGIAECSEQDNFSRKKGRQIAEGRVRVGKCLQVIVERELTKTELRDAVINTILHPETARTAPEPAVHSADDWADANSNDFGNDFIDLVLQR